MSDPQNVIRSSVMAASYAYHWQRWTSYKTLDEVCDTIGGEFSETRQRGAFNQPFHVQHESGAKVFFGSPYDTQPIVLEVPGEACEKASQKFLDVGWNLGARLTRYDVACDIEPAAEARKRLIQCYQTFKRGKVETGLSKDSVDLRKNDRPGEGWTCYFGSPSSAGFLRVYDKRGPLRMEFQRRVEKKQASEFAQMVVGEGPKKVWQMHGWGINFPMPWYQELLARDAPELPATNKTRSTFEEILLNLEHAVGPSLFALQLLGFPLEKLARAPKNPSFEFIQKWEQASRAADEYGYDGAKLRRELKCLSKSRRR